LSHVTTTLLILKGINHKKGPYEKQTKSLRHRVYDPPGEARGHDPHGSSFLYFDISKSNKNQSLYVYITQIKHGLLVIFLAYLHFNPKFSGKSVTK
jgi:hypothetical protein